MAEDGLNGQQVVLAMYVVIVSVAGIFGAFLPFVVENLRRPAYLFLFELPATSAGLAAYGALTVGTLFAVPLVAVVLASRYVVEDPDSTD